MTNIPATIMAATEVIGSYHDLWHVEQSFGSATCGPGPCSIAPEGKSRRT
ncbi:hypothetical protein QFZ30_001168 [Arthrobacter pascens]|nr:hypothetical protein [Arthrobacter pascens]